MAPRQTGGQEPAKGDVTAAALDLIAPLYEKLIAEEPVPGLVVGVVRGDEQPRFLNLGLADAAAGRPVAVDTRFRIASMTKVFTALTVLALRDEGLVDLEAPFGRYVPQARDLAPPTSDGAPPTVRDLLTHVAGFVTDDPWADRLLGLPETGLDALIAGGDLFARSPGLGFEYSNLGYALLGRIIANILGQPFQAVVARRLLAPLAMAETTFDVAKIPAGALALGHRRERENWIYEPAEPDGAFAAIGGLVTTAPDYARFVAFLLDAWPARDGPSRGPVRRASVRELALAHSAPWPAEVRELDRRRFIVSSAYGYGLVDSVEPTLGRFLHHAGGLPGYGSHMIFSPDAGLGLFAFGNRTSPQVARTNFAAVVALRDAGLLAPRALTPSGPLAAAVAAAVRAYEAGCIETALDLLAPNLLLDRSAELRDAELADLRSRLGPASLESMDARHALAGGFTLACAGGKVLGTLSLTPGPAPKVQSLTFAAAPS